MIYDPFDMSLALREDLTLMYRSCDDNTLDLGWSPLHEVRKATNHPEDFTRPSW